MEILEIAKSVGNLGGLGVFVLIVFWLVDKGYIKVGNFSKNGDGSKTGTMGQTIPTDARVTKAEDVPAWARQLIEYTNHEMTERVDKLISVSENLAKGIEKIHIKHDEWDRFGIPARCDKVKSS